MQYRERRDAQFSQRITRRNDRWLVIWKKLLTSGKGRLGIAIRRCSDRDSLLLTKKPPQIELTQYVFDIDTATQLGIQRPRRSGKRDNRRYNDGSDELLEFAAF